MQIILNEKEYLELKNKSIDEVDSFKLAGELARRMEIEMPKCCTSTSYSVKVMVKDAKGAYRYLPYKVTIERVKESD